MEKYNWRQLNHLQIGRYAEYFVKMEFTLFGFDVYTAEVDERGIDFVIRKGTDQYYDIQVKSSRAMNYIFFPKASFDLRNNLLAAVVLFFEGKEPECYLVPSMAWTTPNALFVSRDYQGKQSPPEWGLNLNQRNMELLSPYLLEKSVKNL